MPDYIDAMLKYQKQNEPDFNQYPVRLRSTMQEFYKFHPEACDNYQKSLNVKFGHVIVDEVGENDAPIFIRLACTWNRDNDLDTNSLKSLVHCISKWKTGKLVDEQSEQSRRRYTEGL